MRSFFYTNNEVYLNLITPLNDFALKDTKSTKEAVGFNKYNVFTTSLLKKKPEASAELYKHLEYTDYCSKFTVFVSINLVGFFYLLSIFNSNAKLSFYVFFYNVFLYLFYIVSFR